MYRIMGQQFLPQKPCSLAWTEQGFSLIEVLVAAALGMSLLAMAFASTVAGGNLFRHDLVRTRLNQQLRGAFDVLASDLREAGERLPANFPAVEVVNGADGAADELILRRNLVDEVLLFCQDVTAGTTSTEVLVADDTSGVPGCVYSSQSHNFGVWQAYRTRDGAEINRTVKAYAYNFDTRDGEFLEYSGETDAGNRLYINRASGEWEFSYPAGSSALYLLEEWHYRLEPEVGGGNLLQVVVNGDPAAPMNITYGVTNFQLLAVKQDGTELTSFVASDSWVDLRAIEVSLSGSMVHRGRLVESALSARLYPRNILSN